VFPFHFTLVMLHKESVINFILFLIKTCQHTVLHEQNKIKVK
jgi:hypothetical protein